MESGSDSRGKNLTPWVTSIPVEARVYPSDKGKAHSALSLSNLERDCPEGKTIRVVVKKARGNFTPEERTEKRLQAMRLQREKKVSRLSQLSLQL